jgi:hypothetical protein
MALSGSSVTINNDTQLSSNVYLKKYVLTISMRGVRWNKHKLNRLCHVSFQEGSLPCLLLTSTLAVCENVPFGAPPASAVLGAIYHVCTFYINKCFRYMCSMKKTSKIMLVGVMVVLLLISDRKTISLLHFH